MKDKAECPDCGAWMQDWGATWRCPWAKTGAADVADIGGRPALTCGLPYATKRTEIAAPIHGRRTD